MVVRASGLVLGSSRKQTRKLIKQAMNFQISIDTRARARTHTLYNYNIAVSENNVYVNLCFISFLGLL